MSKTQNLGVVCEIRGGGCGRFNVRLYDTYGRCLDEQRCPSSRTVWLTVPERGEYEISVSACPFGGMNLLGAHRYVMLTPENTVVQRFIFMRRPCPAIPVHFTLTDAAYPDMPIEGGKLLLCPSMW